MAPQENIKRKRKNKNSKDLEGDIDINVSQGSCKRFVATIPSYKLKARQNVLRSQAQVVYGD